MELDADAAGRALEPVAAPLGMSPIEAAYGVFQLAVATMTRAVKAVSTYRGRDPRDFVLCGFGGNGPVVAAAIARELQMRRVLVPPAPGVFSAAGLLLSEVEHEFVRTLPARGGSATPELLLAGFRELEEQAHGALAAEGRRARCDRRLALRRHPLRRPGVRADAARRGRRSGPRPDRGGLRRRASPHVRPRVRRVDRHRQPEADGPGGRERRRRVRPARRPRARRAEERTRSAYFGPAHGSLDVPVISRAALLDSPPRQGPLIVEEYDSTCVVPPGCVVTLDPLGNIDIVLDPEQG